MKVNRLEHLIKVKDLKIQEVEKIMRKWNHITFTRFHLFYVFNNKYCLIHSLIPLPLSLLPLLLLLLSLRYTGLHYYSFSNHKHFIYFTFENSTGPPMTGVPVKSLSTQSLKSSGPTLSRLRPNLWRILELDSGIMGLRRTAQSRMVSMETARTVPSLAWERGSGTSVHGLCLLINLLAYREWGNKGNTTTLI